MLVLDFLAPDRFSRREGHRLPYLRSLRPHRNAAGAGVSTRDAAPEREDVGAGRPAGRRGARVEQSAVGRARPVADDEGERRRRQDRGARRQDQQGGRTLRAHRQDLPGDGEAATGADLERHDRRGHCRRGRGGRLFHPLVRHRAVARSRAQPACRSGPTRTSSARSGSISWSMPSMRCTTGTARGRSAISTPAAAQERQHRRQGRRYRTWNSARTSCRASSSRSSPPRRSEPEPGSACRSAIASCNRMAEPFRSRPPEGGGSVFVVTLPVSNRPRTGSEVAAEEPARSAGLACLVVDDERDVRELIADVLRQDGFKVVAAASGEEALKQLRKTDLRADPERPEDAEHGWPPPVQAHFRFPPCGGRQDRLPDGRHDQPGRTGLPARGKAAVPRKARQTRRSQEFRFEVRQQGEPRMLICRPRTQRSTTLEDSHLLNEALADQRPHRRL